MVRMRMQNHKVRARARLVGGAIYRTCTNFGLTHNARRDILCCVATKPDGLSAQEDTEMATEKIVQMPRIDVVQNSSEMVLDTLAVLAKQREEVQKMTRESFEKMNTLVRA